MFDVGALTTSTPRAVAASTSTLSRPTPALRDDLELGRRGQHLGVHGRRGAHQQRVGFGHGGQQLFAIRAVDPADLYLVAECGDGRFGQFVGDEYYGKAHPASLMGLNGWVVGGRLASVDVTVVGSGPNGLAAAVICARAGLSVQVFEAQPTLGGGARTLPDPEFPGVVHDICSAVHPLALASPFLAEFDLPARGVELIAADVSYANPLPDRPSAIGYHDLDRTCSELDDGASWRRLFGPLVEHVDGALGFFLGDKRSLPPDLLTTARTGLTPPGSGAPSWGSSFGVPMPVRFLPALPHTQFRRSVARLRRRTPDAGHSPTPSARRSRRR